MAAHAPAASRDAGSGPFTPRNSGGFDRSRMKPTWTSALFARLLDYPGHARISGFLRWASPIFHVPCTRPFIVTRHEDVVEVLSRDRDFPVPWREKMEALTEGENFVLGMPRDEKYALSYQQLARVFPREDVAAIIEPRAAEISAAKLGGVTRMDVIQQLMWAVPTELTCEYYGIPLSADFAYWTVAVSGYVFGPPSAKVDQQAMAAAGCLRAAIHRGLERAKKDPDAGTVMARLVREQQLDPSVSDKVITAQLFGMVLGFIPTNLIASGNVIDTLLRFPKFMAETRAAALADDDQRLWLCLQEALRFRFINPGTWRVCARKTTIAAGTSRATVVPKGAVVLASAQSAMFDSRKLRLPHEFNPNRPAEDYLTFGYGQHWCIGAYMAMAQITATFKALLLKEGLRRASGGDGKLRRITIYPSSMTVEFDA